MPEWVVPTMAGQDIEALEQAAAANPEDAGAFTTLAAAYAEADRLDEAAEAFERAATLAPEAVEIQLGLAAVHHARGDDEAVELAVQRAVELDPDHPGVWLTIYEVSDSDEHPNDRIVGAARYLAVAGDEPEAAAVRVDLVELLTAAGNRLASAEADPATVEWSAELAAILPDVREALPAAELAPVEARIRGGRARLLAAAGLATRPATPAAALLADQAALPGLAAGLAELQAAAELAPLDAELTGLADTLTTLQSEAEARLEHAHFDDLTHRLFEAVAEAEAQLVAGQLDAAIAGFQDALQQVGELGDDHQPPYQVAAAMAYHGLAHTVAACAAEEEDEAACAELLAVALEAANEAYDRDPQFDTQLRAELASQLAELEAGARADDEAPAQPELEWEPAAAGEAGPRSAAEDVATEEATAPDEEGVVEAEPEEVATPYGEPGAEAQAEEADVPVEEPLDTAEPEEVELPDVASAADVESAPAPADSEGSSEPSELLTELPDLGEPEPRDDAPLDLSLEASAKPAADLASMGEASAETLLATGAAAMAAGDLDDALAAFEQALEATDERVVQANAWCGIAACRREMGQAGEALAAADAAAELDSRCVDAFLLQGELAADSGHWRGALAAYQHGEAAAPDDPRIHRGLGAVLTQLEDWEGALVSLEKAYAGLPQDAQVIFHMGEVFLATGRQEHAVACFEEAIELGLPAETADELRAFVEQFKAEQAAKPAPQPKPPAQPDLRPADLADQNPDEFDPDTAPPEVSRPKQSQNLELRERVIRKAVSGLSFDPELHKKCRLCQAVNEKDAQACYKCGESFSAAEKRAATGGGRRHKPARNGPCFIATAACGHEAAPEVAILRRYRDQRLSTKLAGRAFTALYDRLSPPAARWIAARPVWQRRVRQHVIRPLARAAARRLAAPIEED